MASIATRGCCWTRPEGLGFGDRATRVQGGSAATVTSQRPATAPRDAGRQGSRISEEGPTLATQPAIASGAADSSLARDADDAHCWRDRGALRREQTGTQALAAPPTSSEQGAFLAPAPGTLTLRKWQRARQRG